MADVKTQLDEIARQSTLDSELELCRKQVETLNQEKVVVEEKKVNPVDAEFLNLRNFKLERVLKNDCENNTINLLGTINGDEAN